MQRNQLPHFGMHLLPWHADFDGLCHLPAGDYEAHLVVHLAVKSHVDLEEGNELARIREVYYICFL